MNERALLDDIRDNPDDTSLRLILADWLDDSGQYDRAEFIRLLCRADGEADDNQRGLLQMRAATLLGRWAAHWLGPLPHDRLLWDRGTIVLRFADPGELTRPFPDHPASDWVTGLALHLPPCLLAQRPDALADCPRAAEIIELRLERQMLSAARLPELFAGLDLARLRHLSLRANNLGEDAARRLKTFPWFARLRSFAIGRGNEPAEAHRSAPRPLDVRTIRGSARGEGLVQLLVESDGFGLNDRLDLSGQDLWNGSIQALAGAPFLARIHRLELSHNNIGPAGVESLAGSPYTANLAELNLAHNPLTAEGAEHLASGGSFAALKRLDLSSTNIGPRGVIAIASSLHLPALEELNLSANVIGDEGIRALAADDSLPKLQRLSLRGSVLGLEGVELVRHSGLWPKVPYQLEAAGATRTSDSLRVTHYGDTTEEDSPANRMAIVARSKGLRALTIIGNGTPMTASELRFLCESTTLRGLESLTLDQVGLTDELLERLLDSPLVETLTELRLPGNALEKGSGKLLGRCRRLRSMGQLDLSNNDLGDGLLELVSGVRNVAVIRLGAMSLSPETAFETGLIAGERDLEVQAESWPEHSILRLGEHLGQVRAGRSSTNNVLTAHPAAIEMLAKCSVRRRLVRLNLCFLEAHHDAMLDELERLSGMDSLRELTVTSEHPATRLEKPGRLAEGVFRRLASMPWFGPLQRLVIECEGVESELAEVKGWRPEAIVFNCVIPEQESVDRLKQKFGDKVVSIAYKGIPSAW